MKKFKVPTQSELELIKEYIRYDESNGILVCKKTRCRARVGSIAGFNHGSGYNFLNRSSSKRKYLGCYSTIEEAGQAVINFCTKKEK